MNKHFYVPCVDRAWIYALIDGTFTVRQSDIVEYRSESMFKNQVGAYMYKDADEKYRKCSNREGELCFLNRHAGYVVWLQERDDERVKRTLREHISERITPIKDALEHHYTNLKALEEG